MTRFDFVAFKQGDLWGGLAIYDNTTVKPQQHLKALVDFTNNVAKHPFGSLIVLWSYMKSTDSVTFLNLYEYTGNVTGLGLGPTKFPSPEFDDFAPSSPIGPPVVNTLRVANLSSLTGELNSPPELRLVVSLLARGATADAFQQSLCQHYLFQQFDSSKPCRKDLE